MPKSVPDEREGVGGVPRIAGGKSLTNSQNVLNWFIDNWRVWFDGAGIALILALAGWLFRRKRKDAPASANAPTVSGSPSTRLSTGATAEGSLVGTQNLGPGFTAHTVNIHPPATQSDSGVSPAPESRKIALDAWEMLLAAVGEASALTSIIQDRPVFSYGGADDLRDRQAMEDSGLTETEIARVLNHLKGNSRQRGFTLICDRKRLRRVETQAQLFFNHVLKSKWLIPEPVADAFLETGRSLRVAMIALNIGLENPDTVNLEEQRRISDAKVRELQGGGMRELEHLLRSHFS